MKSPIKEKGMWNKMWLAKVMKTQKILIEPFFGSFSPILAQFLYKNRFEKFISVPKTHKPVHHIYA